jgi:hypothetical protein
MFRKYLVSKISLVVVVAVLLSLVGGSVLAKKPEVNPVSETGVISGAYKTSDGELRLVNGPDDVNPSEELIQWNQEGSQGEQGIQGEPGPEGPAGPGSRVFVATPAFVGGVLYTNNTTLQPVPGLSLDVSAETDNSTLVVTMTTMSSASYGILPMVVLVDDTQFHFAVTTDLFTLRTSSFSFFVNGLTAGTHNVSVLWLAIPDGQYVEAWLYPPSNLVVTVYSP